MKPNCRIRSAWLPSACWRTIDRRTSVAESAVSELPAACAPDPWPVLATALMAWNRRNGSDSR